MTWDEQKTVSPGNSQGELTSEEWNDHVEDQKNHSDRHGYDGTDEIATALRYHPESEPETPESGVVRWFDETEQAFKAKFDDGESVTLAQK